MRRPVRRFARPRIRAVLDAAAVPTWRPPRTATADAASLHFVLSPGRLPRGRRVYAIGDIHGCLAELRRLHDAIADDLTLRPPGSALLLHLGDYIDFGPDSAGVVALLAAGPPLAGLLTINLAGDHERTARDALSGDAAAATDWLHMGGQAALESWDIRAGAPRGEWRAMIPAAHVAFLDSLAIDHREGDYLFVHAGILPGTPPEHQRTTDLRWIREPFLSHSGDHGCVVVHGHTITEEPQILPNRIGIDTGAFFSGRLTALALEGTERWLVEAREEDGTIGAQTRSIA